MTAKIGLVGCGRWGANILRDLQALGCDVHVVMRMIGDRVVQATGRTVYGSIKSLPQDLSGVVVATPTSTHREVLLQVLEHLHCPIFCEKPLAASSEDARVIEKRGGKCRVFVMDKWRYHPGIMLLANLVRDRTYGDLVGLKTLRVQHGNPHADVPAAWTYLPHDIAILREVLGHYPSFRYSVKDEKGDVAIGILGHHPWAVVEFSSLHSEKKREVRAYFEEAMVLLPSETSEALVIQTRQGVTALPFSPEMPLYLELEHFVNYLAGKSVQPKSTVYDGIRTAELIEAILS